jgi:hypothetical protein
MGAGLRTKLIANRAASALVQRLRNSSRPRNLGFSVATVCEHAVVQVVVSPPPLCAEHFKLLAGPGGGRLTAVLKAVSYLDVYLFGFRQLDASLLEQFPGVVKSAIVRAADGAP